MRSIKTIKAILLISSLVASSISCADDGSFIDDWMAMVAKTKEEQPHWVTPLATVTPRLEQEVRIDISKQYMNNGLDYTNYGGGKGLEVIPTEDTEIIINLPNYQTRDVRNSKGTTTLGNNPDSAWQDESLLVKYRLLSANEENGNYILTAFLGVSLPTATDEWTYSNKKDVYTATIAGGKGWGDRQSGVSIQSTLGLSEITGTQLKSGTNIPSAQWNNTLQGHVSEYFWPEVEVNATHFEDGAYHGKNQVMLTYGLMLGRFKINDHSNFIFGAGYQDSISDTRSNPYDRGWTTSARITF